MAKPGAVWKEVRVAGVGPIHTHSYRMCPQIKRNLVSDPRYDAVGSSSLREELFNTYIKAGASDSAGSKPTDATSQPQPGSRPEEDEAERERQRKERKERAVREREEKVRAERSKLEAEIDRSKQGLTREEGELEFRCAG